MSEVILKKEMIRLEKKKKESYGKGEKRDGIGRVVR